MLVANVREAANSRHFRSLSRMCRISGSRRKGMEKRHPCGKNRLEKTPEQRAGQLGDSLLSSGDVSLFLGYRMNYSIIGCLFSRLVKQFWIVEMYHTGEVCDFRAEQRQLPAFCNVVMSLIEEN
jgi:hypothetical protein